MDCKILYSLIGSLYPQNQQKEEEYYLIIKQLENDKNLGNIEREDILKLIEKGISYYSRKIHSNSIKYTTEEIKYFKSNIESLKKIYKFI